MRKALFAFLIIGTAVVAAWPYIFSSKQDFKIKSKPTAALSICTSSNAQLGPQVIYRVRGDLTTVTFKPVEEEKALTIPSDYFFFNNGCHTSPKTLSSENIKFGYQGKVHATPQYYHILYVNYPDLKPIHIDQEFTLTSRPMPAKASNVLIVNISKNGKSSQKRQRRLYDLWRTNTAQEYIDYVVRRPHLDYILTPEKIGTDIKKYSYDPENVTSYPSQFDQYFQIKEGKMLRHFRCRDHYDDRSKGSCDHTFYSQDNKYVFQVSFNSKLVTDIEKIEEGVKQLLKSFEK